MRRLERHTSKYQEITLGTPHKTAGTVVLVSRNLDEPGGERIPGFGNENAAVSTCHNARKSVFIVRASVHCRAAPKEWTAFRTRQCLCQQQVGINETELKPRRNLQQSSSTLTVNNKQDDYAVAFAATRRRLSRLLSSTAAARPRVEVPFSRGRFRWKSKRRGGSPAFASHSRSMS